MPELPDLVHVEDVLREALAGKTISAARTGDPTVLRIMVREPFPALLAGRRLETVERRGQFMRFGLDGGLVIVVNAMLAGRYKLIASGSADAKKKDPRALGLALSFIDAPELQYVDDKRMGKVSSRAPGTKNRSRLRRAGPRSDVTGLHAGGLRQGDRQKAGSDPRVPHGQAGARLDRQRLRRRDPVRRANTPRPSAASCNRPRSMRSTKRSAVCSARRSPRSEGGTNHPR